MVGRGGREHSIVMELATSEQTTNLYAAPGNGGIAQQATYVDIDEMDIDRLKSYMPG